MMKSVADMFVRCSLQVRNFNEPGLAMSDCCQSYATSAVEMSSGRKMWRCEQHRGIRRIETGPAFDRVFVNEKEED